jgi:hypothetical protein
MYHVRETDAQNGPGMEASGCNVRGETIQTAQYSATEAGSTASIQVDSDKSNTVIPLNAIVLQDQSRDAAMSRSMRPQ